MIQAKPKIYIAYRRKDKNRLKAIIVIAKLLRKFNFHVWYDKKAIKGGDSWPFECDQGLKWANNFLLVAHKDTHDGKIVSREIETAIIRESQDKFDKIVFLKMHHSVDLESYNALLSRINIIDNREKGWKEQLEIAFLPKKEELPIEELSRLIKSKNKQAEEKALILLQKMFNFKEPMTLAQALQMLLKNVMATDQKKKIEDLIITIRRREILLKRAKEKTPPKAVIVKHNKMLKEIEAEYSSVLKNATLLFEGLVYLLKPFNIEDRDIANNIVKLGISRETKQIIINKLKKYKIIKQVGKTLWIIDDKFGKRITEKVFFGKASMVEFKKIEALFYGEN